MPTRQPSVLDSLFFGDLLRRYRFAVGLTQEALAERAGLSARAISDLERGLRNAPRRETVRLLADTLGLNAEARAGLELAARRPRHRSVLLEGSQEPLGTAAVRSTKLVGRAAEVEALRGKLRSARAGRGGLVLLSGEPGIGKTRLLEESAIEAQQNHMLVLWGRCWESEGAPPFWPWTELLQGLIRNREPPVLRADLAAGAPFVAELVPEVRELLPDLPPAPELEPREARFRLFDAITIVLQNVARSQPLLLVLDDLHWADKPSLLLLEFMLPSMRVSPTIVLGTYRDTDLKDDAPLTEVLGSPWRRTAGCQRPCAGRSKQSCSRPPAGEICQDGRD